MRCAGQQPWELTQPAPRCSCCNMQALASCCCWDAAFDWDTTIYWRTPYPIAPPIPHTRTQALTHDAPTWLNAKPIKELGKPVGVGRGHGEVHSSRAAAYARLQHRAAPHAAVSAPHAAVPAPHTAVPTTHAAVPAPHAALQAHGGQRSGGRSAEPDAPAARAALAAVDGPVAAVHAALPCCRRCRLVGHAAARAAVLEHCIRRLQGRERMERHMRDDVTTGDDRAAGSCSNTNRDPLLMPMAAKRVGDAKHQVGF
jgi:hypothetical protein